MTNKSPTLPVSAAQELLNSLKKSFPVFQRNDPLAIGIDKQIIERLPETSLKILRLALTYHTKSSRYLQKTLSSATRFDLDGSPKEEINDTHRAHAQQLLNERAKKNAERIKAQAEFDRLRQAEAAELEATKKRAEKMNQLAMKFAK